MCRPHAAVMRWAWVLPRRRLFPRPALERRLPAREMTLLRSGAFPRRRLIPEYSFPAPAAVPQRPTVAWTPLPARQLAVLMVIPTQWPATRMPTRPAATRMPIRRRPTTALAPIPGPTTAQMPIPRRPAAAQMSRPRPSAAPGRGGQIQSAGRKPVRRRRRPFRLPALPAQRNPKSPAAKRFPDPDGRARAPVPAGRPTRADSALGQDRRARRTSPRQAPAWHRTARRRLASLRSACLPVPQSPTDPRRAHSPGPHPQRPTHPRKAHSPEPDPQEPTHPRKGLPAGPARKRWGPDSVGRWRGPGSPEPKAAAERTRERRHVPASTRQEAPEPTNQT
jgi:hypothetical protein